MTLYNLNKLSNEKKRLIAVGKLNGKGVKTPQKSITVSMMSKEDYQNMVRPLFNILNKNKRSDR